LSRQLDGAGALRTVPPSIVLRRWSGPSDAASATEVARRTGARLAVFGALVGSGADSVQLTATLYDAEARKPVGETELRGSALRMDALVDSVAVRLLNELARTRPVTAVRRASLGSSSLPALKAFLEGERFYRQANTDSAIASYERSVELDSSFCLGWRRLGQVPEWSTLSGDWPGDRPRLLVHARVLPHGRACTMAGGARRGAAIPQGLSGARCRSRPRASRPMGERRRAQLQVARF